MTPTRKIQSLVFGYFVWLGLSYALAFFSVAHQDPMGVAIYGFLTFFVLMVIGAISIGLPATFIALRYWDSISKPPKIMAWATLLSPLTLVFLMVVLAFFDP